MTKNSNAVVQSVPTKNIAIEDIRNIEDVKNILKKIAGQRINNVDFGGQKVDFYINKDDELVSRGEGAVPGQSRNNIIKKNDKTYIEGLKKSEDFVKKVNEELKRQEEKEQEKLKLEEKSRQENKAREEAENTKKQEEIRKQQEKEQKEKEELERKQTEEKLRLEEELRQRQEQKLLKDAQDKELALNQIKEKLNKLPGLEKKEAKENKNHDLVFGFLIEDKNLENLQGIVAENQEDFEQSVKDILNNHLNKEVGNLNIKKTGNNDNQIIELGNQNLEKLVSLLNKQELEKYLQDIANNKVTASLELRLKDLGVGEDQSQSLANQLVMNKGIEYVDGLVSDKGNITIAKDVLELRLNSEVKDNYQVGVFKKIFDLQNQNNKNLQDLELSLIKIAIDENNLQKEIVNSYKEILGEQLTTLGNSAENDDILRKEAILKITDNINKFNDKKEFSPFLSDLNSKIEEQIKEIEEQKRKEAVEIEEKNKKQLFESAIKVESQAYMDAQVDIIKEKLRNLKFEEKEVEQKATALASSPAIARDLSNAAKSPKDKDGNDEFATKAFKIKLQEALPNASEEDLQIYIKKTTDNLTDQITKENKDREIKLEDVILQMNQKLISIASDPDQMKVILELDKDKSEVKNQKDNFSLSKDEKKDLEGISDAIHKSIKAYLSAEEKDKSVAKNALLNLLDPKQKELPKDPTFQLLAKSAGCILDDNKMKKKDGSLVKGTYEMLSLIGDEFSELAKEENEKDVKGYESTFKNICTASAALDKKYKQQEDGLTVRLGSVLEESLEKNKDSLEEGGSNLKKYCARAIKVAGFAVLSAFGLFLPGLLLLYLFRNWGEGKSQEEIQEEEKLEQERQSMTIQKMAMASRNEENNTSLFPKTEKLTEEFTKEVKNDLETVNKKLEEKVETLNTLKEEKDIKNKITSETKESLQDKPVETKDTLEAQDIKDTQGNKETEEDTMKKTKKIEPKDDFQERSSKRKLKLEDLDIKDFKGLKGLSKDDSELAVSKKGSFVEGVLRKKDLNIKNQSNEII